MGSGMKGPLGLYWWVFIVTCPWHDFWLQSLLLRFHFFAMISVEQTSWFLSGESGLCHIIIRRAGQLLAVCYQQYSEASAVRAARASKDVSKLSRVLNHLAGGSVSLLRDRVRIHVSVFDLAGPCQSHMYPLEDAKRTLAHATSNNKNPYSTSKPTRIRTLIHTVRTAERSHLAIASS